MIRVEITFSRRPCKHWGLHPIYRSEMRWQHTRWQGRGLYLRWVCIAVLRRDSTGYRHELFAVAKACRAAMMYRDDPALCDWADRIIAAAEDGL